MTIAEQLEAQHELRMKLARYGEARTSRDQLFRDARAAGLAVSEIARLAGLTRQHVSAIIAGTR